ncbi:MAG: MATE family efflux transporter [Pseudomonadales bacterium]|nr:MATE family efflux transporter [Pseudomonadales bacterium]
MKNKTTDLTVGPVTPLILGMAIPMVWGIVSMIAISLGDIYFIGQLGAKELAAISFIFPITMIFGRLSRGMGTGAGSVIARSLGAGDQQSVERLCRDSLILSIIVMVVFAAIGLASIDIVFSLMGASPEVLTLIHQYIEIWYLGAVFLAIPMAGNAIFRAAGNTRTPSRIMVFTSIINLAIAPVLIFGLFGFPALGLMGAAVATITARGLSVIYTLYILIYRESLLTPSIPTPYEFLQSTRSILHVGLPAAITAMIIPLSAAILIGIIANYGSDAVAAFGIVTRIEALAMVPLMALAGSIAPFVGQNFGAQKYQRIGQGLKSVSILTVGCGLILATILYLFATPIISIFNDDIAVVRVATDFLIIVPISFIGAGLVMVTSASCNALGKPRAAIILAVARFMVFLVPLAFLLGHYFGYVGIFWATFLANFIAAVVAVIILRGLPSVNTKRQI